MIETLTGITLLQLATIWGIVFVAGFVRGLTGVGLAVVLVPLINLVLPPERTVLLAVLIGCLAGLMGYRSAWRNVDRPLVLTITVATIAATPLGLLLLFSTPEDVARLAIAAIAMLAFIVMIAPRAPLPPQGKLPAILTGLLTGLIGAFAAIPGPPVIFYFVRKGVPAAVTRDALIVIFLWAPLAVALLALALGKLDWRLAGLALACFLPLAGGNALGTRFFGKVPERQWRVLVVALIAVSAIGAVFRIV
ncbi:MAG: sulfite exporter TauE/SafE family protein [Sphingomonadales bacterium]|nr:sulfite exporter TauE/SafE family protein [Sphingomonadales bacterium]MBL0023278.1 sulfite exporter TauE/SafE family protein [Sphingomonadales bacterium]